MSKRICRLCGKEFEGRTTQVICNDRHIRICPICGKEFDLNTITMYHATCSRPCGDIYASKVKRGEMKPISLPERPKSEIRHCAVCGKEFKSSSKNRTLCGEPHYSKCPICGKEFRLNVYSHAATCGDPRCASEYRTQCNLERYGVRSTLELPEVKEKIRQTNLDRYGVENGAQSLEVQQKVRQRNLLLYGVEYSVQREDVKAKSRQTNMERRGVPYSVMSEEVKSKARQTNMERRGVENVFQDPAFQEQAKQSCLERYGTEHYTQSADFRQKAESTWMENYGVDNPLKSDVIQSRVEQTSMERYGTRRPQQSDVIRERIRQTNIENKAMSIQDESARKEYLEFRRDPKAYLDKFIHENPTTTPGALSSRLGFEDTTIILTLLHEYGYEMIASNLSSMESAIIDFIRSIDSSIEIDIHNRSVISPQEVDIYLPEYRIGIECNPTATHNSTISLGQYLGDPEAKPLSIDYHSRKSKSCEQQGVFLFHIFGYEWKAKSYIIKSMIRNLLGRNLHRYYARKLHIREVPYQDAMSFLDSNHRQGSTSSKVNIGLYNDDELVSLMTFGKTRMSMGHQSLDDEFTFELIRFCNKINTSVVGGASKLFKYFLKMYSPHKVISFSDIAHTQGKLYSTLGFVAVHESDPGYVWVHSNTDMYLHRVSCQKQNLPKLFTDPNLDISNKTEQQIMVEHGFVQVFDSGVIRWEYTENQ